MATHPDPVSLAADPESGAVQFDTRRVDGGGYPLRLTLGYRRSADFDPRDDAGQDHAVVRAGRGRAVGVVADGVSQSFFGDIAARCLAEGLADFLWRHAAAPPAAEALAAELARLRVQARRQVEGRAIPVDVPELARTGLERLRGSAGSQAVFAAFVLDGARHLAHVYTVGDAAAVLHGGSPGTSLAVAVEAAGRWATHGAPLLGLRADRYAGVSAVVLRSDGARGWGDVLLGADAAEQAFREQAPRLAGYDDVAFVIAQLEDAVAPAVPLVLEASVRVERLPGVEAEPAFAPGAPRSPAAAAFPAPSPLREDQPAPVEGRSGPADTPLRERDRRRLPLPRLQPVVRRRTAAALVLLALSAGAGAQVWLRGDPGDPVARPSRPSVPDVQRERDQSVGVPPHGAPTAAGDARRRAGDDPDAALTGVQTREPAGGRKRTLEEASADEEVRQQSRPTSDEGGAERLQLPSDLRLDPAVPRSESGHIETPHENRRLGGARPSEARTSPRAWPQSRRTETRAPPNQTQPRTHPERNRASSQPAPARPVGRPATAKPAAARLTPVPVAPVRTARVPNLPEGPAAPNPRQQETARPDTPRTGSPHNR